jgi:hypothetical protein
MQHKSLQLLTTFIACSLSKPTVHLQSSNSRHRRAADQPDQLSNHSPLPRERQASGCSPQPEACHGICRTTSIPFLSPMPELSSAPDRQQMTPPPSDGVAWGPRAVLL